MMQFTRLPKNPERGVTILIVGLTLLALIAMATLAIDVASLYVAKNEAQRAADAAALAGAKIFVTSSYTSRPADWSRTALCVSGGPGSSAAANQQAALVASVNTIAGQTAIITNIVCNFDDSDANTNPRITVTVQTGTAPAYFARIFGVQRGMVSATATAEAYNMSGHNIPVQLTGVKPWLIPNCNPHVVVGGGTGNPNCPAGGGNRYAYLIDPVNGTIKNPSTFIGRDLDINRILSGAPGPSGGTLNFYGLDFPNVPPAPICPAASAVSCGGPIGSGANTYVDNLACSSQIPMRCGEPIGGSNPITPDTDAVEVASSPTTIGIQCLIHSTGVTVDDGQDTFTPLPSLDPPLTITGGSNNPDLNLRGVTNISRSDSVVTVPVHDGSTLCTGPGSCAAVTHVMGFLQIGIRNATGGALVHIVVLNAAGCNSTLVGGFPGSSDNAVSPGSVSPIIVRLVQTPTP